jgi:hypothetical protein
MEYQPNGSIKSPKSWRVELPKVEISFGYFFDRYTILLVKVDRLPSSQHANLENELVSYRAELSRLDIPASISKEISDLQFVNREIWDNMNKFYELASTTNATSGNLVQLTIQITALNQQRAFLKRQIDQVFDSSFSEEKSYFSDSTQILLDGQET